LPSGFFPIALSMGLTRLFRHAKPDGVDPAFAPSTGTAVRGGLTFREAHYVVEAASESGSLGSLDMVEVNPTLGSYEDNEHTVEMGLALISSALGSRIV